jgi:hypothetical protein
MLSVPAVPSRRRRLFVVFLLSVVSPLLMGTKYVKPIDPADASWLVSQLDYARYHWEGFHRIGPYPTAILPLAKNYPR